MKFASRKKPERGKQDMGKPSVKADSETWQRAEEMIRAANRVLAIAHIAPDGDAIGSLLGLTMILRSIGKQVQPVIQDAPHPRFDYLTGLRDIRQKATEEFDLVVTVDSADRSRIGAVLSLQRQGDVPMVVFDHHITNTCYGTVNVIDSTVASTAEMMLRLSRQMQVTLTTELATALLTGILTDTLCFRTTNTTWETMANAVDLVRCGAPMAEITRKALVLRPWESLKLQAGGLVSAHIDQGVAHAAVTRKLRKELGVRDERGDGGLVGTMITANEVDIAAVFVEQANGDIEVGMRAAPGFDVSQVAITLGGGGHPAAAGCTVSGPMRDAVNRVLPLLHEAAQKR
jgi:phosphoesterase RecJ-like protein